MKIILTFLLILFVLSNDSCKKEDWVCGVEKPQENLPWLKQMIQQELYGCYEIYSFVFEKKEYISLANCEGTPDGMTSIYNCAGTVTFSYGGIGGAPHDYGMPNTFTVEYYSSHRRLIYITE